MAAFEKGHTKKGGRQKGTRNKASANVKELLAKVYCEEDFIADFAKLRKSRDDRVLLEVLKLALAYQYGKPKPLDDDGSAFNGIDLSGFPMRHIPLESTSIGCAFPPTPGGTSLGGPNYRDHNSGSAL
jgi:hypothetical protein